MPLETNPFTRLGVGGTFSRTFTIFLERWVDFLTISAVVFVPLLFMMVTLLTAILSVTQAAFKEDYALDSTYMVKVYKSTFHHVIGKLVAEQIFYIFFGIAAQAMMAMMVAELYVDRRPSLMDCLKKALKLFCNIFCAGFIVGVVMVVGYFLLALNFFYAGFIVRAVMVLGYFLLLLIVAACFYPQSALGILLAVGFMVAAMVAIVYLSVSMMLLSPIVMVEQKRPMEAIRRCWNLASGHRCFLFCTVFCFFIGNVIFRHIVAAVILGNDPVERASVFGCLVQFASSLVVLPLTAIIKTVVYLNIRAEQEGLNHDVLLQDLTEGDGAGDNSRSSTAITSDAQKCEALDMEGGFVSSEPLV